MNHTWTPEMLRIGAVVAVIFMAVAIWLFRKDRPMMLVACFLVFAFFIYQPVMQMEKQECERARAQALQKPQTVNIWLGPVLVMTIETDTDSADNPARE